MVTDGSVSLPAPLPREHEPLFGQPSNYSLTRRELTAEIRRRRRDGWQHWEINARFSYRRAA